MSPRLFRRLLLALALWSLIVAGLAAAGPVEMTIFYSPSCSHCETFEAEVVPRLQQEFGSGLGVRTVDITSAEGLAQLEAVEQRLGVTVDYLPIVLLGDQLF